MTTATFVLRRHEDPSGVSGTGDVAWGAEFPDGAVAIRWPGKHPSTATWEDIRGPEAIHGHGGKTVVRYDDNSRLVRAYALVMPYLLAGGHNPVVCGPHPEHPDRLRLVFAPGDEAGWRRWIALLDGSSDAAIQEDIGGETEHRWTSSDGDIWLVFHTRHTTTTPTTAWEMHDDPEMNR